MDGGVKEHAPVDRERRRAEIGPFTLEKKLMTMRCRAGESPELALGGKGLVRGPGVLWKM